MDISIKLKQLRHEKGLTQKELADNTGLSYAAIAAYEKALRSPNAKAMAALEQFFGVTAVELLSEKNENEENFGDFLRNVRKSQNMAQKEFAERICVSQSYLSRLELGKETPTPKLVKLIHLEFNIPYYDNRKPPLKAIVRRIKKNPPKLTSSGKDILFITKVNRYGITCGRTCRYFPELTMYVGCTVSIHRDGSVWYKDKRIGFIDL